jgi:hypothetical protein
MILRRALEIQFEGRRPVGEPAQHGSGRCLRREERAGRKSTKTTMGS